MSHLSEDCGPSNVDVVWNIMLNWLKDITYGSNVVAFLEELAYAAIGNILKNNREMVDICAA